MGETATQNGYAEAAIEFERAAKKHEIEGDPLAAAEATLELGRCLFYLRSADRLPALAGRIIHLASESAAVLPPGGYLTLRVWAAILRRGETEPGPLLDLLHERRRMHRAKNGEASPGPWEDDEE